jgi:hypothetical protein
MKFSKANAKLRRLESVRGIKPYLKGERKVYSFDLLSGHNCPYAKDCKSMAVPRPGGSGLMIQDGPNTDFRCFSASQEAFYKPVYNLRKQNAEEILAIAALKGSQGVADALEAALPHNAGVIRIHVGGDFKIRSYFEGWIELAKRRPDILFYAYTKSLPFWIMNSDKLNSLPNFVLTASKGGMKDNLIEQYNLRQAVVVASKSEARKLGLQIDHDDSHAADPSKRNTSFALLIHGLQPSGSRWGKAVKALKGVGSYTR